jgi:1,4-dihydroxy-2-naphthoate octaprenyltransferase
MTKIKAWIGAARLRTLPLSVSGIIVGASLGINYMLFGNEHIFLSNGANGMEQLSRDSIWQSPIFWLAILTTIGFQVLSNFANDYGDGIKGTDDHREGEQRMVASGIISPKQMRQGMYITAAITLLIASMLIFAAFGNESFLLAFVFFNLAIASVIAAVKYTVGKKAYGYSGFGDLFVFIFFGIVAVVGSFFLFVKTIYLPVFLPAITIGTFSTAVLNLNNMRDIDNDARVGKYTLVVKMGSKNAKKYHYALLGFGMLSAISFTLIEFKALTQFLYAVAFIPLLINMIKVAKNKKPELLDGELKKVALSTFAFAILFSIFH